MPVRKQKRFGVFFKRTDAEKQIFKNSKDLENTQTSLAEAMRMIERLSEEINSLKENNNTENTDTEQ